jgi:hypothetical protein
VEVLPMTAESFRLILVVLFLIWTVALVLFLVVSFILFRRLSGIRASINKAIAESKEAAKPILQIAAIIEVVKSGMDLVDRFFKVRKGGKRNGRATQG